MNNNVIEIQVRAVIPVEGSFAIFLGDASKTFVIYVDEPVGTAISMFMRGTAKERPLTHDLLANVLLAFGAKVERVVINHINGPIFHARLIIVAENELHARKLIELDARPSDSIAMAMQQGAPVFVAEHVWASVEDVTERLEQISHLGENTKSATKPARGIAGLSSVFEQASDDDELDDDLAALLSSDDEDELDDNLAALLGDDDDDDDEEDEDDFIDIDDLMFDDDEDDDEDDSASSPNRHK